MFCEIIFVCFLASVILSFVYSTQRVNFYGHTNEGNLIL